ncbi:restriction endonuclease subunit S [Lactobacillus ruminis]|uniref:Restriction endonuclease subunit S n=3 Tax=Ligilactobacillus ruminis TaxID=1623 RepID=A0A6A8GYN3_9LACO|nr:restriction endonuclease subunit S [Ligilactobacillus ruminis]MSA67682.1 restriction endonuclease subunit S [Ligilactobacillus ruminis]MSB35237.1 restriction endonuclease subunit S [Ligilactobacillus ruminis]
MNKKKESKVVPNVRFKGFTDDWKQRKLTEIVNRVNKSSNSDVLPKVEFEDIVSGEGRLNKDISSKFDSRKGTLFEPENILYGKLRPYLKNWLFSDFEGVALGDFWVFEATDVSVPSFDYYLIQSDDYQKVANDTSGTKMPRSDWKNVSSTDFAIPSKDEQKQIGAFFKQLDDTITLHQQKITLLIKLKKAMLEKMFPKKGTVIPEFRFNGFANAWEQRKLEEIITEYKETVDSDCTLPILTSSKTEGVILQEEHFGRKQQHDITGYNILPRNYCTYRNRSDGVDFTFNINKCCDKGIISKFYPVFSGKNSDVFFLSLVLNNSDEVVREIAYTCTGTGQKVLSFLNLQKMKVRVPSFDEQKEIATYFDSLDNLIILHQRKIDKIKNMKKAMLNQMFI